MVLLVIHTYPSRVKEDCSCYTTKGKGNKMLTTPRHLPIRTELNDAQKKFFEQAQLKAASVGELEGRYKETHSVEEVSQKVSSAISFLDDVLRVKEEYVETPGIPKILKAIKN